MGFYGHVDHRFFVFFRGLGWENQTGGSGRSRSALLTSDEKTKTLRRRKTDQNMDFTTKNAKCLALASPATQSGEEFEPRKKRKTRKKVEANLAT